MGEKAEEATLRAGALLPHSTTIPAKRQLPYAVSALELLCEGFPCARAARARKQIVITDPA
jgi:hypothetical protein